jgi:hypothetical protein
MSRYRDYRHEHRTSGSFGTGFGLSLGCLCGIAVFFVGGLVLVIAVCAGAIHLGGRHRDASSGREEATTPAAEPPAAGPGETSVVGPVGVTLRGVKLGPVALEQIGGGRTESDRPQLAARIQVSNRSHTKKVDYQRWENTFRSFASLRDDRGNNYKVIDFGFGLKVVGAAREDSIHPGGSVDDVLVFEAPIDIARFLVLELDAERVGETGKFLFKIPSSAWKK